MDRRRTTRADPRPARRPRRPTRPAARTDGGRHRRPAAGRAARPERWLLVFDNAERPADIAGYRLGGAGHVLITSRAPGWGALGGRLEVDVLARTETIALLCARLPTLNTELADELATELGDLPLAVAQAAGYLGQTDLPPADHLRRFREHRETLLARGEVVGYHGRTAVDPAVPDRL